MQNVSQETAEKQDRFICKLPKDKNPTYLAEVDRKLLLEAGMRYHIRRISHNHAVTDGDLLSLPPFTDRPRQDGEDLEAA
jgi:hypothetical protein